jgi:hypothetical protein
MPRPCRLAAEEIVIGDPDRGDHPRGGTLAQESARLSEQVCSRRGTAAAGHS